MIAFSESESIRGDAVAVYLKLLSTCSPRGSEGNQENFNWDSRPDRDSEPKPPEYESEALRLEPAC
jgi:hypothetical protein